MKDKEFYTAKITKAKQDIEKWELAIYQLENPIVNIPKNKEATKIISIRVSKSMADKVKKRFIEVIQTEF